MVAIFSVYVYGIPVTCKSLSVCLFGTHDITLMEWPIDFKFIICKNSQDLNVELSSAQLVPIAAG